MNMRARGASALPGRQAPDTGPGVVTTRRVGIQLLSTSGSLLGFTRPTYRTHHFD